MVLVTALTVLILAPEYFLPVRMVGADFHATMNGKEAGETIQTIIDRETVQAKLLKPGEREEMANQSGSLVRRLFHVEQQQPSGAPWGWCDI